MKRVCVLLLVIIMFLTQFLTACNAGTTDPVDNPSLKTEGGDQPVSSQPAADEERLPALAEKFEEPLVDYESLSQEELLQSADGSLTFIGMGYNVLENTYMEPSGFSFSYPIFKPEKVADRLEKGDPPVSTSRTIIGESVKDYSEQLKAELSLSADYPMFSGNVAGEMDMKKTKKENTYFVKSFSGYVKEIQYIKATDDLKTILDEEFEKALNSSMSPELLFQRYGTHVLIEAQMGARCTFNYSYSAVSEESSSSIQSKVDTAYRCISGSASTEDVKQNASFMSSTTFKCSLSGGPNISHLTFSDLLKNYPSWVAGIKDSAPTIYGISNINSLLPIWDFADNPERTSELKAYFENRGGSISAFLEEMSSIPEPVPQIEYIEDIVITSDKSKSKAQNGSAYEGYERIDVDLNAGAEGDFIYLWFKKTTDANKALRDIRFTYSKAETISGYTKNNHDLNAGAGGKYIYLWTNNSDKSKNPIKNICIVTGKNADVPSGYEYGMVGNEIAELNKDAKGYYIYLGFKR